ncbi:hypothetical protein F5051DRAFT_446377 [Lentinula edodes]|nr:hypothetical protein F5051DRAFT_446377 [Lentinula edodes]
MIRRHLSRTAGTDRHQLVSTLFHLVSYPQVALELGKRHPQGVFKKSYKRNPEFSIPQQLLAGRSRLPSLSSRKSSRSSASQVNRFTGKSSSLLLSSSFSTRVFSSIQFTPAHFSSLQSDLIVPSIPRSTSQSFAADHLHSTIVPMRLNIAFFVVSFAAAAYALPITDVSNTNANVADGRAGVVLPRANSDGFFQSNSGPPEPSTSGPPRPSISSRGASETEKTSSKPLKYTFLGLEGETKSRDGGAYASQANQLTRELIQRHIPPGQALPKLEPSNEFLGDPDEVKFKVDLSQYGLGKCTAKIRTNTHAWMDGDATVSAEWNGKSESYKPGEWSDPHLT